jgi:hypothetical protein
VAAAKFPPQTVYITTGLNYRMPRRRPGHSDRGGTDPAGELVDPGGGRHRACSGSGRQTIVVLGGPRVSDPILYQLVVNYLPN